MKEIEKEEFYKLTCPFAPKILPTETKKNTDEFFNRLQQWLDKRATNYMNHIELQNYDMLTGQRLFSPVISEKESNTSPNRNVFDALYNENFKIKQQKAMKVEKFKRESVKMANKSKASDATNDIYKNMKLESYQMIFNLLHEDNVIKYHEGLEKKIQETLPFEVISSIQPIFIELKNQNESLNIEEFFLAMDHIYQQLTVIDRRKLTEWYIRNKRSSSPRKKRNENSKQIEASRFSFKPSITTTSEIIFQNSKKYSKDLYQRNIDFIKAKEIYHNDMYNDKIEAEIKGTTIFNIRLHV